jgi:hypothetical protein
MESIVNNILMHIHTLNKINWEGPAAFVIAIIAVLVLLRKWSLLMMIILVLVIGWGAQDLIVYSLETRHQVISLPVLIYLFGGVVIFIIAFISFFRSK